MSSILLNSSPTPKLAHIIKTPTRSKPHAGTVKFMRCFSWEFIAGKYAADKIRMNNPKRGSLPQNKLIKPITAEITPNSVEIILVDFFIASKRDLF